MANSTAGVGNFPGSQNYFGPGLLSALIQALEMGVIINQAITFVGHTMVYNPLPSESLDSKMKRSLQRSDSSLGIGERPIVKFIALFALGISMFETAISFQSSWYAFVVNFGNWPKAVAVRWPQRIQSLILVALAAPVQSFLIWRCWLLTRKNKYILASLSFLLVVSIAFGIINTIKVFNTDFSINLDTMSLPAPSSIDPIFVTTLTIPAFLDVCLTGILLNFLLRSRTVVVSNRFRKILQTVIIIVWEAALPPSICAIVTLATYFTLADFSSWDLLFQALLGQLYVISLFVTLNGFNDVKNRNRDVDPTTALGYNLNGDDQIIHRSRISSSNEFTMTIEIGSSEGRSSQSKRSHTILQPARSARSPRLQLSFEPGSAPHLIDITESRDEEPSPTIPSSATNTVLDPEGIFYPRALNNEWKAEKMTKLNGGDPEKSDHGQSREVECNSTKTTNSKGLFSK